MNAFRSAALATLLALESCTASESYYLVGGLKFKEREDFLEESLCAYTIPSTDFLRVLTTRAHEDEFLVAYLPKKELIINLSVERNRDGAVFDMYTVRSLIFSGEELTLIHNHNNLGVSTSESIPLYWIAPSALDIETYVRLVSEGASMTYGIITPYGLLTMETDFSLSAQLYNPYFSRLIVDEAVHIQQSLTHVDHDELGMWAKEYSGIMRLSFTPIE